LADAISPRRQRTRCRRETDEQTNEQTDGQTERHRHRVQPRFWGGDLIMKTDAKRRLTTTADRRHGVGGKDQRECRI